jgi:hypothetical protein
MKLQYNNTGGYAERIETHSGTKGTGTVDFSGGALEIYGVNVDDKTVDGWTLSPDTWVYASATTFTITGVDRTDYFPIGTKLKITNGTVKYFYVESATFSSDTTVTIIANDDYSIANSAITAPNYSYESNPVDFPHWFGYTPTWGNLTLGNGTEDFRFTINGQTMTYIGELVFGSTSAVTGNVNVSTPTAISNPDAANQIGTATLFDATGDVYVGLPQTLSSSAFSIYAVDASSTYSHRQALSASIPFTWTTSDRIHFTVTAQV